MPLAFHPNDPSFNRENALYLAHASNFAYCRRPAPRAAEQLSLRAIPFLNKVTRTRGYLGICDTHAVLAFRGTDPITLPNWLTDVVVKLVESDHYEGRVHRGFSAALKRTWGTLESHLHEIENKPLFLTGHSMGGALAVLTACRLARAGRPPVATYTFGAPRVGDPTFCAGYSLPTYRIVNRLDLVPELPLASLESLLPQKPHLTNERILRSLKQIAGRVRCYGHVKTFVYIDRDGVITTDADIAPWHSHAVARAIATRGKSFLEGITDHLMSSYIGGLEGKIGKKQTANRRRVRKSGGACGHEMVDLPSAAADKMTSVIEETVKCDDL